MTRAVVVLRIHAGAAHHRGGALPGHNVTGPSAEVCVTGNSNRVLGLFRHLAKGVK